MYMYIYIYIRDTSFWDFRSIHHVHCFWDLSGELKHQFQITRIKDFIWDVGPKITYNSGLWTCTTPAEFCFGIVALENQIFYADLEQQILAPDYLPTIHFANLVKSAYDRHYELICFGCD